MRILSSALLLALTPLASLPAIADDENGAAPATALEAAPISPNPNTLVNATYLGLVTESISLERASDLDLTAGTGLSILQIAPNSPAIKADFQKGDVLAKMDDQILVNPAQFRVLVRSHSASDAVVFKVIRKGKTLTIKTNLGTQKMPPITPGGEDANFFVGGNNNAIRIPMHGQWNMPPAIPEDFLKQLPPDVRARLRMAQPNPHADKPTDPSTKDTEADDELTLGENDAAAPSGLNFSTRIISSDDTHTIEIERGTREHLRITDKNNKELYNGALPKDDKAWQAVPEEVRAKAQSLAGEGTKEIKIETPEKKTTGKSL